MRWTIPGLVFTLLAAHTATASGVPAAAPFVAWQAPPAYAEAKHGDGPERIYYFTTGGHVDDASAHWTDRVRIVGAQLPPGQGLDAWFAAVRVRAGKDCPGLLTRAGPSGLRGDLGSLYEMWHCPKDPLDGRGEVSLYKVIADGSQIWLMIAEGRYPAFAPGKTPLGKAQLARWTAFENSFVLCAGYLKPACMGDAATLARAPVVAMDATEAAAAKRAETLGRKIYRQDALARKAGTALGPARLGAKSGIRGWVALPESDTGGSVYFFRGDRDKPDLAWVVTLAHDGKTSVNAGSPGALTPDLLRRFRARQTALATQTRPCTPELDTAVVADPHDGGWLVYTLATSRDPDEIWIGGSTRYRLAPDAVTVTDARASARGCLSTRRKDASGRPLTDLVLTRSLADVPDEMEVMRQLQTGLPMTIGTRTAIWRIRAGRIDKVRPRATQRMPRAR